MVNTKKGIQAIIKLMVINKTDAISQAFLAWLMLLAIEILWKLIGPTLGKTK